MQKIRQNSVQRNMETIRPSRSPEWPKPFEKLLLRLRSVGRESDMIPSWEQLELRYREAEASMELLLLWNGRIAGHARAHVADASLIYRDGPIGTQWAKETLAEAMSEWASERRLRQG